MASNNTNLLAALQALLAEGRKIEAIKRYREATGIGLAEAKATVEALEQGQALPTKQPVDSSLEMEIVSLLEGGRKIEAIKRYREATGVGLKEAKDAVEALERGQPLPTKQAVDSSFETKIVSLLEDGKKIGAIKLYRQRTGLGLKEAKDAVEAIAANRGIVTPSRLGCLGVVLFLAVILALSFVSSAFILAADTTKLLAPIEVYFSPNGGCTEAIVREIRGAKSTVFVQAYWFTSVPITKAVVDAHKRGVKAEVILDLSRAEIDNTQAEVLVEGGVPTFIDDKHVTAHNKVIIIDGQVVITGSFNFTEQAEKSNAENLMVVRDKGIADKFTANWKVHREHSGRYGKR